MIRMASQALQMFGADAVTYVVPAVVVLGFLIQHRLQKFAGLHR